MSERQDMSPLQDHERDPLCDSGHRSISPDSNTCIGSLSRWIRYRDQFYEWYRLEPERRLYQTPPPRPIRDHRRTPPPNKAIERKRLRALERRLAPVDDDWNDPEVGEEGSSNAGGSSVFNVHDTDEMEGVLRTLGFDSQYDWTSQGSSDIPEGVSAPRALEPKKTTPDVVLLEDTQGKAPLTEPSDSADADLHPPTELFSPPLPLPLSPVRDSSPKPKLQGPSIVARLREMAEYREKRDPSAPKSVFCNAETFVWGCEEFFGPGSAHVPTRGVPKGPYPTPDVNSVLLSSDSESEPEPTHEASESAHEAFESAHEAFESTHEASESYLTQGLKATAGVVHKLKTKVEELSKLQEKDEDTAAAKGWFGQVKASVGETASQLLQVRDFSGLLEACKPCVELLTKNCSDFALGTTLRILETTESSINNRIKQKGGKRKRESQATDSTPNKEAKKDVI